MAQKSINGFFRHGVIFEYLEKSFVFFIEKRIKKKESNSREIFLVQDKQLNKKYLGSNFISKYFYFDFNTISYLNLYKQKYNLSKF